jgi:hypothetical protein
MKDNKFNGILRNNSMKVSLPFLALFSSIVVSFVFGVYFLNFTLGIPYTTEGGSIIFKVHMYTLILLFANVISISKNGFPASFRILKGIIPSIDFYYIGLILIVMIGLYHNGLGGLAFVLDTLVAPILAVLLILRLTEKQKAFILNLIWILLLINSSIAILEFLFKTHLFTGSGIIYEFRSSSLLGHPLNNSLITASVMIPLLVRLPPIKMYISALIFIASLLAYGGRTGLVIAILTLFLLLLKKPMSFLFNNGSVNLRTLLVLLLFSLIAPFVLYYIVDLGFGSRIFNGLEYDHSASTRFSVFQLFNYISDSELLFGAPSTLFDRVEQITGVTTIENFWLVWIFKYGLVFSVPFFYGLIKLVLHLGRGDFSCTLSSFSFLLLCSANNSLSTKTSALMIFCIVLFLANKRICKLCYSLQKT